MALLTSCGGGGGPSSTPQPGTGTLQITTSGTLFPAFDPSIRDYVVSPTSGSAVQVSVNAPQDTQVSVANQGFRSSAFTAQVSLTAGQSFPLVVNASGGSKTYYVRCLPADFPVWTTERPGTPQAEYFIFAPDISVSTGTARNYIVIADSYGVPLWWYHTAISPIDATLLPNGNIAWTSLPTGEERQLDGTSVHKFTADSTIGGTLDNHELLLLPNGDYLFITDVIRGPVDLTPFGGFAASQIVDTQIEEVSPAGTLVWRWSPMDHIPISETDPLWRPKFIVQQFPADPYHMNSVEPDGDGFVVSLRHLNAVIRIDKASGNITWKLGGTPRPESMAFRGDTYGNFGGQHDARILPDGTLTVHDNGTQQGRAPRAVRYRLDTAARTATLVEQVTDPDVPTSGCCGSARKLAGGDWVMSWGQNAAVTELTPAGNRVFRLTFHDPPYYSYRVAPVPSGVLTRDALRKGMDAQFPR